MPSPVSLPFVFDKFRALAIKRSGQPRLALLEVAQCSMGPQFLRLNGSELCLLGSGQRVSCILQILHFGQEIHSTKAVLSAMTVETEDCISRDEDMHQLLQRRVSLAPLTTSIRTFQQSMRFLLKSSDKILRC